MTTTAFLWTACTTIVALLVYFWMIFNVGRARGKFKIDAPITEGPAAFLSVLRVQANTVEQLVMFLPALWLCALYSGDRYAAIGGAVWIVGRLWYALAYYRNPAKRGPGFVLTTLSTLGLIAAAVIGMLQQ